MSLFCDPSGAPTLWVTRVSHATRSTRKARSGFRESNSMKAKSWCVYIILRGERYHTGITNDLPHRLGQHGVSKALHVEQFGTGSEAAVREREIKGWSRAKKEALWRSL